MQNVQNAAEIQQRVINLVELYRTKVGKESQAAKQLAEEYQNQYDREMDIAFDLHDQGIGMCALNIDIPEEEVDEIRANEQLLGYFYKKVAREKADEKVLNQLLADKYESSIFTAEETEFLTVHFKEMVNYIIQTPNNDLSAVEGYDYYDIDLLPKEVLDLIKERVDIPSSSKIYNPFTGFAQLACLYQDCSFLCEESYMSYHKRWNAYCDKVREKEQIVEYKAAENKLYAWMRVALYANNINTTIIEDGLIPQKYEAVISYIPFIPSAIPNNTHERDSFEQLDTETLNKLPLAYKNLTEGGKIVLILPKKVCWKKGQSYPLQVFWEQLINDGSLSEIIQLPDVMGKNSHEDYCIIIAEKGSSYTETTFIDARFASKKSDNELFNQIFDTDAYHAMLQNDGIEPGTGRLKMRTYPYFSVYTDLLIPQVYAVETPSGPTAPLILTELCTPETSHIYDVQENLPEDTPWVTEKDLSTIYRGPINIFELRKASCQNNPKGWRYGNRKMSIFEIAMIGSTITSIDMHISEYRNCWYLDGTKDAILFKLTDEGIVSALINASGKTIAVNPDIHVLYPTDTIDAFSLLSILSMPVVYRQMIAYSDFGLYEHFKDVLVPTDKRIVNDEMARMNNEKEVVKKLEDSLYNIRRSMRMRKHALTQSLSSLEAMFYALNAFRERNAGHLADDDVISRVKGTTVREAFDYISNGIKSMMPVLEHLADVEYTFALEEWIDPEKFIEDYIARNEKGWLNFIPVITWEKGHNQAKDDFYTKRGELFLKKGQSLRQFRFPKDALEHVFKNIISNAQSWAFDDKSREDYQLKFSWHIGGDDKTLAIEIENNGTPIPEDRDTTSLLEYGVSSALHHDGHNGIGCNEIDDIMQRYNGKVEIVSTPQSTFTVKYVLTFNNIDDIVSKYGVIKPVNF